MINVGPFWFSRGSIPEVIFTPRLSVRRICTWSHILFAATVRPRVTQIVLLERRLCQTPSERLRARRGKRLCKCFGESAQSFVSAIGIDKAAHNTRGSARRCRVSPLAPDHL